MIAVGLFIGGYLLEFIRNNYKSNEIKKLKESNSIIFDEKELLKNELTIISSIIKDQSNETLRVFATEHLNAND